MKSRENPSEKNSYKGKWWLAKTDNVLLGEITLIEDKTEELKNSLSGDFVDFVDAIAPHLLYFEEGTKNLSGTDPKDRKVIYPT